MLILPKLTPDHVEVFMERNQRMLSWALQLTDHDRSRAEDLLHDAFIQFTLMRPDLGNIREIDNYLFIVLRNLHLSQVRRATRNPVGVLSIVDYDSAEASLRAVDPQA